MKQNLTEFKGETDNSTTVVGDFTTPFSTTELHKIIKDIHDLNNTIHQLSRTTYTEHYTQRMQKM